MAAAGSMATGRLSPRRERRRRAGAPNRGRRQAGLGLSLLAGAALLTLAAQALPVANATAAPAAAMAAGAAATAAAPACTGAVGGAIGAQNRMHVTAYFTGPAGSEALPVVIDTGAQDTVLPEAMLEALGYHPEFGITTILGVTGQMPARRFSVAYPAVSDGSGMVTLGSGRLTVLGVSGTGATPSLLGLSAVKGADLQISGGQWEMRSECGDSGV